MPYFLIGVSEDGAYIEEIKDIAKFLEERAAYHDFAPKLPDGDLNYWNDKVVLIKGEIVTPRPVQVVTKYEVE